MLGAARSIYLRIKKWNDIYIARAESAYALSIRFVNRWIQQLRWHTGQGHPIPARRTHEVIRGLHYYFLIAQCTRLHEVYAIHAPANRLLLLLTRKRIAVLLRRKNEGMLLMPVLQ